MNKMGVPWRVLAIIVIALVIYYWVISIGCNDRLIQISEVKYELNRTLEQLEKLKQWNNNLRNQIKKHEHTNNSLLGQMPPANQYRNLIRRIYSNTKELWYYVSYHLREAVSKDLSPEKIQILLQEVTERKRSLLSDQEKLPTLDGYEKWRRREAASVSYLVQRRLKYLQNPPDCQNTRKLMCQHTACGFGCDHHHLVNCLESAYASERTLVVLHATWGYKTSINREWTKAFQPLSTCTSSTNRFSESSKNKQDVNTAVYNVVSNPFSASVIPDDLALRISRFNGDPTTWWVGQLLKYVQRPSRHMQAVINRTIASMKATSPIVGVHVRRTDKLIWEAKFHNISEYMFHVEEYYEQLELTRAVDVRRVYLATDDVTVFQEAVSSYPRYKFYGNELRAKLAAPSLRLSRRALLGLLVDLYMLASCDYVVCTFSSNVGRMVYEMMQANRVDASYSIHSLDSQYHFNGWDKCFHTAVMNNKESPSGIALHVGDVIKSVCMNNSINVSVSERNTFGPIPWYKTAERIVKHPFPKYEQVPLDPGTGSSTTEGESTLSTSGSWSNIHL